MSNRLWATGVLFLCYVLIYYDCTTCPHTHTFYLRSLLQDAFPLRLRSVHYVNPPKFMGRLLTFFKMFVPAKIRDRVSTSKIYRVYDVVSCRRDNTLYTTSINTQWEYKHYVPVKNTARCVWRLRVSTAWTREPVGWFTQSTIKRLSWRQFSFIVSITSK